MDQKIVVDMKSVSRISNDGHIFNGIYESSLPQILRPGEKMKLHVFLDRSILDIFINDRWASSVRIFPTTETATGASFFTEGKTHVDRLGAYVMGNTVIAPPPTVDVELIPSNELSDNAIKYIQNGQLYICKNGKTYTILGLEL